MTSVAPGWTGPLVDTHCHLQLLEEPDRLNAALGSARSVGVEQIICIGLNLEDSRRCRDIAEAHRGVYFSVGWHPHQTSPPTASERFELAELLRHPRAVAVGEIGIDLYFRPGYHETPLEVQRQQMAMLLELAAEAGKPIIVHDRDAHREVLDILSSWESVTGVMHCFSGDADHARRCRERGFLLSFSGIVTFPRSGDVQAAVRAVDGAGYVVETDAPFLAPVPHRGRPNQPAFVADTARAVAELRGQEDAQVRNASTANARELFGLDAGDRLDP